MIFVTGATGLVGSYLIKKLLDKGHSIKALRREGSDLSLVSDVVNRVEWVEGDLLDAVLLDRELEGVESVFHCAALVSFDGKNKELLNDTNVTGTRNIVNAALNNGVQNLIHISSVAAIGRSKQDEFITEDKKWERSSYNSEYAVSKFNAELEAWRGQEEGLNVIVVNPSVILGPADWNKTSTRIFKLAYDQNRFYSGGTMNYIDVRDLVESIYGLYEQDKYGERYILSAGHISYRELMTKIASGFNKKPPTIRANYFLLFALVSLEKFRSWISGKKPQITPEVLRLSRSNFVYDNSKVKKELGIVFRSIEDTVSWSCEELMKEPSV